MKPESIKPATFADVTGTSAGARIGERSGSRLLELAERIREQVEALDQADNDAIATRWQKLSAEAEADGGEVWQAPPTQQDIAEMWHYLPESDRSEADGRLTDLAGKPTRWEPYHNELRAVLDDSRLVRVADAWQQDSAALETGDAPAQGGLNPLVPILRAYREHVLYTDAPLWLDSERRERGSGRGDGRDACPPARAGRSQAR